MRLEGFGSIKSLRTTALIYPHLLYAIPIWGSTYNTYLHKIVALQNKAVKLISRVK